jgi:hypothetical protein
MTSRTLLEERVLKTDVLGRVKTPPERREALLDEFEKSAMSGKKFAEFIGVKYQTWASWRQERRRRRQRSAGAGSVAEGGAPAVRFVEAMVQGEVAAAKSATAALRVHLPGGAHLEIADRHQALLAGELLRALKSTQAALSC